MARSKKAGCLGSGLRVIGVLLITGVLAGATAAYLGYRDYEEFQDQLILESGQSETLTIPPDTAWPGVVERVAAAGLVERELYFDIWGRRTGLADQARAGTFYLQGPLSLDELAQVLRRGGRAEDVEVTFREGLTIFDYADAYEQAGLGERAAFLEVAGRPERYDWASDRKETLEGYLYPETYRFAAGAPPEVVIDRLVEQWRAEVEPLFDEHSEAFENLRERYDMDRHDLVIMASLIERETSVDSERDIISRVFYNRLERGMQLQTDPTCVYGESTYGQVPTPDLCRDPLNRYSTYVIAGLPPGPIASPSVASVEAALQPSEDPEVQDYLFFVARRDGSGEHYFTTNYRDHRRAIERFLLNR